MTTVTKLMTASETQTIYTKEFITNPITLHAFGIYSSCMDTTISQLSTRQCIMSQTVRGIILLNYMYCERRGY